MKKFRRFYYDCFSRVYDPFVALHSSDRQGRLRAYLAKQTGAGPGDRVLDICTGTGALLEKLRPQVAPHGMAVGVDFSRGMLSVASRKTKGPSGVCLVQAHAGSLPFKATVFDAVTCAHAFYELKGMSQVACLEEVLRVMKPNRPFLMMEHEIPENRFVRLLFFVRLFSMGARRAVEILKEERRFLRGFFDSVEKVPPPAVIQRSGCVTPTSCRIRTQDESPLLVLRHFRMEPGPKELGRGAGRGPGSS